jgi:hypothetical protein
MKTFWPKDMKTQLPYQFVDELKEFECKVYSLSTCSDPSHLLSLSLLLLLLSL